MRKQLRNWLFLNKNNPTSKAKQQKIFVALLYIIFNANLNAQVNYVSNPSFELIYNCSSTNYVSIAKYWNSLDSSSLGAGGEYYNVCYSNVPTSSFGFQYPKTGNAFIRTQLYCTNPCSFYLSRTYTKNRLTNTLTSGKTYCVKMHVNLENISPYAIDALQIYLGDVSLDTINYSTMPLTYLTPQITNSIGVINDTLNWVEIKGTFTSNGTEKYLVIGNFKTDLTTASTSSWTGQGGGIWSEYLIDDVSVIEFDLSAYAGPDKNINLGDSTFIGRPPEIGLECTWTTGTVTVGVSAGIWVKPTTTGTFSYVVTQNICGNIKKDTVNVNVSPGFVSENEMFSQSISLYPQPANESVVLSLKNHYENELKIEIINVDGKMVRDINLEVRRNKIEIKTGDLADGVYFLRIENSTNQTAIKKLVIAK